MFRAIPKEQAKPVLDLISNCKISLFSKPNSFYAFYVALLSQLQITLTKEIPTAATDGRTLVVNPDYFLGLNSKERVGLLLHEAMHIAFLHSYRLEQRDPELWNQACDYAINDLLLDEGITLPEGGLYEPVFTGLSAEEIYEALNQEENPPSVWGIGKDLIPNGKQAEATIVKAELQALAQSVGKLPQHLQRWFEQLGESHIPWQLLLRRFLSRGRDSRFSYRRINKRCELLPTRMPYGLNSIELMIDTSASISQRQFNQFISEIYHLCQQTKPRQLTVSQFSNGLEARDRIRNKKQLTAIEVVSSGCTLLKDALQTSKANILCIFTDGEIHDLKEAKSNVSNLIWLVYGNDKFIAPFGQVIKLNGSL